MAKNKLQYHFGLLLIWLCINNGSTVNFNPYASNQHNLLHDNADITVATMNMYHNQQNRNNIQNVAQQLQGYANNQQQFYGYYYTPAGPYQLQSQRHEQSAIKSGYQPTTQLWSGLPIVVEDIASQQPIASTRRVNQATATTAFYKQQEIPIDSHTLLPTLNRNSNTQTTTATQLNYNNNNNIIYHRDFRPQITVIPDTELRQQQDDKITWYNREHHQQRERQLQFEMEEERQKQQEQQLQQQQLYAANTNLRINGISNDLRKDNTSDYREHFRRYLENNPRRIKPIY